MDQENQSRWINIMAPVMSHPWKKRKKCLSGWGRSDMIFHVKGDTLSDTILSEIAEKP